jgi:hypothetical protein
MRACWREAWRNDVMPSGNVWHVSGANRVRRCPACTRRVRVARGVALVLGVAGATFVGWLTLVALLA